MNLNENISMNLLENSCAPYASKPSILVRTTQHWMPRAIDAGLTVVAWIGFLYLLATGVGSLMQTGTATQPSESLIFETLGSIGVYLLLATAMATGLLIWAKYNQLRIQRSERRLRATPVSAEKLAQSFRVHPGVLAFLQRQQRLVVHSDDQGHVQAFEFLTTEKLHSANEPIQLDDPASLSFVTLQDEEWEVELEVELRA